MSKLEELKQEADQAGISYSPNIGEKKLQEKLDEFYANEANDVDIAEPVVDTEDTKEGLKNKSIDPIAEHKRVIKELERENKKTRVVKITMVDKREASTATDAYFSSGSVSMRVPLDTYVEMPILLIKMAKESKALIHKKVGDGRFSEPAFVPRYVVEYKD